MDNEQYLKAIRELFNSETGKAVLKDWKETFVDTSAAANTVEGTFYKLGIKEWIQRLIIDATESHQSESISITEDED